MRMNSSLTNSWLRIIIKIVLAVSVLLPPESIFANLQKETAAREVVERFCEAEFEGVQDIRFALVKFSPARKVQEERRDSQFRGFVKTWEVDPLMVVVSYRILDIIIQGDRAIATISYERLIRTEGDLGKRQLIRDYKAEDIVKINLVYKDEKWRILDPPDPRISRKAILAYYKAKLDRMATILDNPKTSEEQKQSYRKLIGDLTILEAEK